MQFRLKFKYKLSGINKVLSESKIVSELPISTILGEHHTSNDCRDQNHESSNKTHKESSNETTSRI